MDTNDGGLVTMSSKERDRLRVVQAVWAGLPCIFSATPGFRTFHAAGLVANDGDELRRRMEEVRDPATYARLRAGASMLRRLLAPERLAPRYLVGL